MRRPRGRPPSDDVLTPAEWAVVEGVRHGLSNPAIARRRGISADAVKYHLANALQKLGMSSRREIRAWDGVRKAGALPAPGSRPPSVQSLGPIGQIARTVRDVRAAEAFFRDVVGLPHLYSFGDYAFFDCGGARLFLAQADAAPADSILYFRVDDIHQACAQLAARGAAFIAAPHLVHRHEDGTEEWMAFFEDPDGRPLALMTQARPAADPET